MAYYMKRSMPKERNEGSEEHAQPLSLVALPHSTRDEIPSWEMEMRSEGEGEI